MITLQSTANRFYKLLAGDQTSHGTYRHTEDRTDSLKKEIKRTAQTLREPPSIVLWEKHLEGTRSIGIVPICEDNTCIWGAIDIDVYTIDHAALQTLLDTKKIPAIVCRTKSNGAHVYLFLSEPVPAADLMSRLRELAALLGFGESEIYPKQNTVLRDRGDVGSWLNMPYFGDTRYAVRADGRGLTADAFLNLAERNQITREQLSQLPLRPTVEEFKDGPPCLETLVITGFGEGMRNNGMFALGTLAKKISPDNWEELLDTWNHKYMTPPLPRNEIDQIIKSFRKKDYFYRCNDQPIVSYCNSTLCRMRKYGVGLTEGTTLFEAISILDTEPPIFFVSLKIGGVVHVSPDLLLDSRKFQNAVLSQLKIIIPLFRSDVWLDTISKLLANAINIDVPREVGISGQFEELLEQFCTDRHAANQRDEIILGKPWTDPESGKIWFRLRDLEAHLQRMKFEQYNRGQIVIKIKEMGGASLQIDAKGKNVRAWFIPPGQFTWQIKPHDTPVIDESPL